VAAARGKVNVPAQVEWQWEEEGGKVGVPEGHGRKDAGVSRSQSDGLSREGRGCNLTRGNDAEEWREEGFEGLSAAPAG